MLRGTRPALIALLLAAGPAAAQAPSPPPPRFVHDSAGFFSPTAAARADDAIAAMRRTEGETLVVETFAAAPADRAKAVRAMTRKAREDFFQQWAQERARALNVEGVYVLICRSPAWTQATLGPATEDRVFPERDRLHLEYLLAVRTTKRQYDAELLDAVAFVRAALYANRNGLAPPESAGPWMEAGLVALGLLAVWLVLSLVRRALGFWGRHPDGDPEIAPCTGMAFAGGLAGGLAGAQAMTWLLDRFRGRHRAAREPSAPPPVVPGRAQPEPPDEGLIGTEHYGPDDGGSLETRAEEYGGE